jgi:hypothetical protein
VPAPASAELLWYTPERFTRAYELRRGQDVVARLRFEPAPAISWMLRDRQEASAEADGGRWDLSVTRHGFLGIRGRIEVTGTHTGVLEAGVLLFRGNLTIANVPALRWRGGIFKYSSDAFEDGRGTPVLRLDRGRYFEKINARVAVLSLTTPPSVVSLLACLGLYIRLLMRKIH